MTDINKIDMAYEESKAVWSPLFNTMREDIQFPLGSQWYEGDLEYAARHKKPTLTLNYTQKFVNGISGFQRQNKTDLKAYPIEGGDTRVAEVYSRLFKWIMNYNENKVSSSFKKTVQGGLGWLVVDMNYDKDVLSGDIVFKAESPFNVLVDPYFKEIDLSDANYIIRHKKLHIEKAKALWPNKKAELDQAITTAPDNDGIREEITVPSDQGEHVLIVEYWYKEYKNRTFVVDTRDISRTQVWEGSKEELNLLLEANESYTNIKRKVPEIRLCIKAGNNKLYDGPNPLGISMFPFVPFFGFYEDATEHMDLRIKGVVRDLKDPQREKNKWRSVIMQTIGKMPQYGWMVEEDAVDDINALRRGDNIIEYRRGRKPEKVDPTQVPTAAMALEQSFDRDLPNIAINLEFLGQGIEKGTPGVTIQHQIRQAVMSIQELFDNLTTAKIMMGRIIQELISKRFTREKINRILGDDLMFYPKDMPQQIKSLAKAIQNMRDRLIEEQAALEEDIQSGAEFTEQQALEIDIEFMRMEDEIVQSQKQLENLKFQLETGLKEEKEFWDRFDATRRTAKFDIKIDETKASPTYRIAAFQSLMQAAQYKVPVPAESIIELMEVPVEQKNQMLAQINENKQRQMELLKFEREKEQRKYDLEIRKIKLQGQVELIKQGFNPQTMQRLPGATRAS